MIILSQFSNNLENLVVLMYMEENVNHAHRMQSKKFSLGLAQCPSPVIAHDAFPTLCDFSVTNREVVYTVQQCRGTNVLVTMSNVRKSPKRGRWSPTYGRKATMICIVVKTHA